MGQQTGLVAGARPGQPVNSEGVVSAGWSTSRAHHLPVGEITEHLSHIYLPHGHQKTVNIVHAMRKDLAGIRDEERICTGHFPLEDMQLKAERVFSKNFITDTDSVSHFYGYATSSGSVGLVLKSVNVEWDVHGAAATSLAMQGSKGSLAIVSSSLDGTVSYTDFAGSQFWPIHQGEKSVSQLVLYGENSALAAVGSQVLTLDLRSRVTPSFLNTGMPTLGLTWHSLNASSVATCGLDGAKIFDMRRSQQPVHFIPGSYFSCQLSPFLNQVKNVIYRISSVIDV